MELCSSEPEPGAQGGGADPSAPGAAAAVAGGAGVLSEADFGLGTSFWVDPLPSVARLEGVL